MFKNRFSPFLCQNSSQNQTIIMLDQGESMVMLQKQAQALPDWSKMVFRFAPRTTNHGNNINVIN
ncbi:MULTISPECIES: hypothetical protein [Pseudoalteromonas]|uniref:hypothetical protein n=1 Tax=Pseudoalteromonas TaxID=53246 RepID=UPI000362DC99|nr:MULTISPECIES: hypothetical protein [Pseudoalteromonas]